MMPTLPTFLAAALVVSVAAVAPPPEPVRQEAKKTTEEKTLECKAAELEIAGVSFRCDPALFVEVWGGLVPEKPLQNRDDKPDYVEPERVLLVLYGTEAAKQNRTLFGLPVIEVARLDGYAKAHALDPAQSAALDRRAAEIKSLLARRPKSFKGEIPFMPYAEGAQDFQTHLSYFRFRNGRGVAFLTHYSIEPSLVSDHALTYVFEGVTDDGLYYVSAMFPVVTPAMPHNYTFEEAARRGLDFTKMNTQTFKKAHAAYVRRAVRNLARLRPDKFQPDLARLNRLLSTINVRRRD